jgi:hypothetical protein
MTWPSVPPGEPTVLYSTALRADGLAPLRPVVGRGPDGGVGTGTPFCSTLPRSPQTRVRQAWLSPFLSHFAYYPNVLDVGLDFSGTQAVSLLEPYL